MNIPEIIEEIEAITGNLANIEATGQGLSSDEFIDKACDQGVLILSFCEQNKISFNEMRFFCFMQVLDFLVILQDLEN